MLAFNVYVLCNVLHVLLVVVSMLPPQRYASGVRKLGDPRLHFHPINSVTSLPNSFAAKQRLPLETGVDTTVHAALESQTNTNKMKNRQVSC